MGGLLTVERANFSCEQEVFLEMPASIVLLTQCFSSQAEPVNVSSRESQSLGAVWTVLTGTQSNGMQRCLSHPIDPEVSGQDLGAVSKQKHRC